MRDWTAPESVRAVRNVGLKVVGRKGRSVQVTEEIVGRRALWMGRLYLHLLDQGSEATAYLEVSVREEFITVWEQNATLAVLHRDQFRRWFWNPAGPYAYDDLVWTVEGTRLCLSICGSVPWFVPEDFVDQLVSVL